jgi:hypothetical protein
MDQNQFTSPFGNPNIKSADVKSVIGNAIPKTEEHPLHILDNQIDPDIKSNSTRLNKNWLQKPIRTYESDIAEAIAHQKTSVMTMAIAESKAKNRGNSIENKPPSHTGRKFFIFILSITFIAAGGMGGYYLYLQSPLAIVPVVQQIQKVPSVIDPDSQIELNVPSLEKGQFVKFLSEKFAMTDTITKTGEIKEFVLNQTMGSTTARLRASQFIQATNFTMLDTLKRALTEQMMVGTVKDSDQNYPFIIFTTDFFQNAYSGMLKWENNMPEEVADIFNYREQYSTDTEISNIIASSTPVEKSISRFYNIRGTFKDKVIMNRDVREFTDSQGNILFLYTFVDRNTILLTTSEAVISAIVSRIEKQTYVR